MEKPLDYATRVAYNGGYKAAWNRLPRSDNPYSVLLHPFLRSWWFKGWDEANYHLTKGLSNGK